MGSSGSTIELQQVKGKKPTSAAKLHGAVKAFLVDAWRAALPKAYANDARQWIMLGADSLLTLGDPEGTDGEEEGEEPATELTFWYYETVEWPQALAEHWLWRALGKGKASFVRLLAKHGYAIKKKSWYPKREDEGRFVVDKKRIGHPDEDGVFWQLPDYDYEEYDSLAPKLKTAAEKIRDGAACQCPYCK